MNTNETISDPMMERHLAEVYETICRCPDVERAVASLHSDTLRELHGWLSRLNVESGIPGLVRGVVTLECCNRFLNRQ
jgi:hypothetical protein